MTTRRIYCVGALGRPCAAHAWFYYSGKGRPPERCAECYAKHERERRRENHHSDFLKRQQLRAEGLHG